MDWNKTKTIFIIVFSILNVFLYSVYVSNYNEDQQLDVIGESSIESDLKNANITMNKLPTATEKITYISGKIKSFDSIDLETVPKNQLVTIRDNSIVEGKFKEPIKLEAITAKSLKDFISDSVYQGQDYKLWSINAKKKEATFFQVTDHQTIFYNRSATLKVYWTDKKEITNYEQTFFGSLKPVGEKISYIKPLQAIKSIFEKGYLKDHTKINFVELGYSTLVPLTETQVLSPTWHIQATVPTEDGDKEEKNFFINAIDSQILEIEKNINFTNKELVNMEYSGQEK